jgi:Ca-activated chloride channel family protein
MKTTTRRIAFGALAACTLAALGALPAAAQQQPTFRTTGDAVRVFVTVTDHDGRIVTTLSKADFEVRDDGKPQPITLFDNTPRPVRLIVMLDVSGSMEGNLPLLRASAAQLFVRLAAEDVARVGTFGEEVTISPSFTRDADALRAALPREIKPDAPTPLWRAIDEAMNAFHDTKGDRTKDDVNAADEDEARPVILVLSDGKDSGLVTFKDFKSKPASQSEVIDRARRENVMIFAIGMRSRMRRGTPGIGPGGLGATLLDDLPDPGLARVAEETGGGYTEVNFGDDLGEAFAAVANELHSQYLLGFAPKRDGKTHDIEVRLAQKGMKSRARKSYVAPR